MIDSQPLHIDLNTKPKSLAEHVPIHNHILLRTGTIVGGENSCICQNVSSIVLVLLFPIPSSLEGNAHKMQVSFVGGGQLTLAINNNHTP